MYLTVLYQNWNTADQFYSEQNLQLFFSYVQKVIDETEQKSPGSAPVGGAVGGTVAVRNPVTMAGTLPQSQVDILQMLSKAQKEYDTVGNTNC